MKKMIYSLPAGIGLHEDGLKRLLNQSDDGRLAAYAEQLADSLDEYIRITESKVQIRNSGYRLKRGKRIKALSSTSSRKDEDRLEATIHEQWQRSIPGRSFLRGCNDGRVIVSSLPSSQIPLYNKGRSLREGWGYVDLLGVGCDYCPVVVELKIKRIDDRSIETPVRAAIEALAYGISLRTAWGHLAQEWRDIVGVDCPVDAPAELTLVVLGTEWYWQAVEASTWFPQVKHAMPLLLRAMRKAGFICCFAAIDAECVESEGRIWTIKGDAREILHFGS